MPLIPLGMVVDATKHDDGVRILQVLPGSPASDNDLRVGATRDLVLTTRMPGNSSLTRSGPPTLMMSNLDALPTGMRIGPFPPELAGLLGLNIPGLELVTLSPRLAQYFGATTGVLVASAAEGGPWKVEDGDVIESIDGRVPSTGEHATRILRSYQAGEKIQLRVLRDRKRRDLVLEAPRMESPTKLPVRIMGTEAAGPAPP